MRADINIYSVPDFEAIATSGEGVFETLREITKLTTESVKAKLK